MEELMVVLFIGLNYVFSVAESEFHIVVLDIGSLNQSFQLPTKTDQELGSAGLSKIEGSNLQSVVFKGNKRSKCNFSQNLHCQIVRSGIGGIFGIRAFSFPPRLFLLNKGMGNGVKSSLNKALILYILDGGFLFFSCL